MRLSQLFGRTLRQAPAEAETASHQLLLRAGMVQQLAAGVYSYLPLAWRALRKIEAIIREEMDACGGQEISMPVLQPIELWEASGRRQTFGETLFTLRDRRQRELALGPTHEEVVVDLFKRHVRSYRDLPLLIYQIQTKFRDEARPRGGLVRVREFTMKDLYSFDADEAGLAESYQKMAGAYRRIFERCSLPVVMVESDSGAIGGKVAHEFLYLTPMGEDRALLCRRCGYAANGEKAAFQKGQGPAQAPLPEEPLPMEEVATPGVKTIRELCDFLGIPSQRTLKAVFYAADGQPAFVAIRGDLEVNEVKLGNALRAHELRLLGEAEVRQAGLTAGSASPVGLGRAAGPGGLAIEGVTVVADDSVLEAPNLVGGANRPDTHLRNLNYGRDWQADIVADIALARDGDPCPRCAGPLQAYRGIEMGNIFQLGTLYSEKLGACFLDRDGQLRPVVMGCYGIGSGRLLAAIVEAHHDDQGIIWPRAVAPYEVHLVALGAEEAVTAAAEGLYGELPGAGVEVLYDDREESAGVKFNDADLLGLPLRVTISRRTLGQGSMELRPRAGEATLAPIAPPAQAVAAIRAALAALP